MNKRKDKIEKTNAIRLLEKENISFEVVKYSFNENEIDALSVAKKINAEPESVFKTLVAEGDKTNINVFVIPGPYELNLKKAAQISGNKKIELIKVKDLLNTTGYIRGGCSPIGMKKKFPTFIDENALLFDEIFVSAGVRGMQICISPDDLLKITNGKIGNLIL